MTRNPHRRRPVAACASLALGATAATAADKPSLVDQVAARLGVTPEQLRAAFGRRSPRASTPRSPRAS